MTDTSLTPRVSDVVGLARGLGIRTVKSFVGDYNVQSRTSKFPCRTNILCLMFPLRNLRRFWITDVPEVRPQG